MEHRRRRLRNTRKLAREDQRGTVETRLSMVERGSIVRLTEELVKVCRETVPDARMSPRHVERCCVSAEHMTEDDSWILENQRREIEM